MKRTKLPTVVLMALLSSTLLAAAPPGRYTIDAASVFDNKTGLTWQRAAPGDRYDWNDAKTYCQSRNASGLGGFSSGWRLPQLKELLTIVDLGVVNPSIDPAFGDNTVADWFWTSTPYAAGSGNAWLVYFNNGSTATGVTADPHRVRCVR